MLMDSIPHFSEDEEDTNVKEKAILTAVPSPPKDNALEPRGPEGQ
jgi:hypothetical protein